MKILAIDTTGMHAALAIVENGRQVIINRVSSGYLPDKRWDEYPLLLPAHHQAFLDKELRSLFRRERDWRGIAAVAASAYSGIFNALQVGLTAARTISALRRLPLIKVDHLLAHAYSTWLERDVRKFSFPILVFSASGSHSDFSLIRNRREYELLSNEIEERRIGGVHSFIGIGKIFREAGKILGIISGREADDKHSIGKLIKSMTAGDPTAYNFSRYYAGGRYNLNFSPLLIGLQSLTKEGKLTKKRRDDIAASFQESICEILKEKILALADTYQAGEVHVTGGLAENLHLRKKLRTGVKNSANNLRLRFPVKKGYRLDNAAMIGCLGYYQEKHKINFKNFIPNITK